MNARNLQAWNIERTDPSTSDGTPGIGQVLMFKLAEVKTALSLFSTQFYPWYEHEKIKPFDAAQFSLKAEKYCEDYYADAVYNPSIGNLMLQCEQIILIAKYNEFLSFKCENGSNSKQKCNLPNDALK